MQTTAWAKEGGALRLAPDEASEDDNSATDADDTPGDESGGNPLEFMMEDEDEDKGLGDGDGGDAKLAEVARGSDDEADVDKEGGAAEVSEGKEAKKRKTKEKKRGIFGWGRRRSAKKDKAAESTWRFPVDDDAEEAEGTDEDRTRAADSWSGVQLGAGRAGKHPKRSKKAKSRS